MKPSFSVKRVLAICMVVMMVLTLSSCFIQSAYSTKHRIVEKNLPQAHPNEGIYATTRATLYYRLYGTDWLYGVDSTIKIPANTTAFEAILRELLQQTRVSESQGVLLGTFPTTYTNAITNVFITDNVVFITLSTDMSESSELEYALLAIINTITHYDTSFSVAFFSETNVDGITKYLDISSCPRICAAAIESKGTSTGAISFKFLSDVVATPSAFARTAAMLAIGGNYDYASTFFTHTDGTAVTPDEVKYLITARPDYKMNPIKNITFSNLSASDNYLYMYLTVNNKQGQVQEMIVMLNLLESNGIMRVDLDRLLLELHNAYNEGGVEYVS